VRVTLLKLGGELLEAPARVAAMARTVARASGPLVVVHGGGREIDAALAAAGIPKRQVDGLRVTDGPTLEIVVSVLAGAVNTRFVAAINAAGGRAVGLTGADAGVAPVKKAPAHRTASGELVDLGLVGEPLRSAAPALVTALLRRGFVPVIACVGASRKGELFNVNADTLAGSLAARLPAARLVIAGGTPGVLDEQGQTIPALDPRDIRALVKAGTASAGMVAKLNATEAAVRAGVKDVVIVDGRDARLLAQWIEGPASEAPANGTRIRR
jgi:acetylglutamate kinase